MSDLIARLEKATGPDRELDWLIFNELQPFASRFKQWPGMAWISSEKGQVIPLYTTSIDAALTLVPEGKLWEIRKLERYERATYKQPFYAEVGIDEGWSEVPALALCIAAMKARAGT